jgi:hypothetical protein
LLSDLLQVANVDDRATLAPVRAAAARYAHNNIVIVLVLLASTNIFIAIYVTCNIFYNNIIRHRYIECNICDHVCIELQ